MICDRSPHLLPIYFLQFLKLCFLQKFKNKMSFFGKLFGKASDKDTVTTGEAIQKLRETEEMLMKKQVSVVTLFPGFFQE